MSFSMVCDTVLAQLEKIRIVPVLVLNDLDTGLKMCEVLSECGLPAAEITFRTRAAASIIKAASERFPELYLGAGTILNVADLKRAFDSGAKFAVAPASTRPWFAPPSRAISRSRPASARRPRPSRRWSSAAAS